MPEVPVHLPHCRYTVRIEPGALANLGALAREAAPHARAALIVDAAIETSHGRVAARSLSAAGYDTTLGVMPADEQHKTLGTVRTLYEVLLGAKLERRSPVVALGGGITGDTAGFVAATYLRGVPLIQCPTTLLAMVDASVGGKVGVNVPQGKNLIGAFHQPSLVVIDPETLRTLPAREVRCGLAECVKHGVIRAPALFDWIDRRAEALLALDMDALVELIERNVRIKAAVVVADEKEAGERAHLNFGHTFAHAIEARTGYGQVHHGEAVALGMLAAARLAADLGLCDRGVADRIGALLKTLGLPTVLADLPPTPDLIETMTLDKKVAGGRIRLVLPERLGAVTVADDAPEPAVAAAWDTLRG